MWQVLTKRGVWRCASIAMNHAVCTDYGTDQPYTPVRLCRAL